MEAYPPNESPVPTGLFMPAIIRQPSPARALTNNREQRKEKAMSLAMHPTMQLKVDGLLAIRARVHTSTAELYAMIGKEPPAQKIRYQVVTKGTHAYHIIELSSSKVRGFRFSYKEAVNFAQELEARADGIVLKLSQAVRQ
jgi:hypothetical protein